MLLHADTSLVTFFSFYFLYQNYLKYPEILLNVPAASAVS